MFPPTKAACHHTKVANAVIVVQTADIVPTSSDLEGKQSDMTHLRLAAGELQLRSPQDQLAGWFPSTVCVFPSKRSSRDPFPASRLLQITEVNVTRRNPTRTGSLWAFIGPAGKQLGGRDCVCVRCGSV